MSNEQLVVSYRDAVKSGEEKEKEWIQILKDEIQRRGLRPFKNRSFPKKA
ncbi:sporulation histidine kinase inhibitor Sda [Neobacillus jeddahensis]